MVYFEKGLVVYPMVADTCYFNYHFVNSGNRRSNIFDVWKKVRIQSNQKGQKYRLMQNKYLWLNSAFTVVALLVSITILLLFKWLPPNLPLFYSLQWGDKQLGNHQQFFIIPALIILITLINYIISWQLHQSQLFFKKMLLTFSMIATLILTITFVKIILIFI